MAYEVSPITLGELVKSVEVCGFVLTETVHPPSLVLPRHIHECANISFVLDGSFTEISGRREQQECRPSSWLLKPAGEIHADRYGRAGARCLIIEVRPERLEAIRTFSKVL